MFTCSWKEDFGLVCPSCGAQRSFIELLHGNFVESLKLFPALLPLIFLVIFVIWHLVKPVKSGPKIIVSTFALSAALMVGNWIVQLSSTSGIH